MDTNEGRGRFVAGDGRLFEKQKFDEEKRYDGGLLFQSLKEKQKGQSLYLLAWRCLVSFAPVGEETDLSDAPAKAMLRIWRYARRQVICERHIRGLPARSR